MSCQFIIINKKQIRMIKPLWEKLNKIHLKDSQYFKDHFFAQSFDNRCSKFAVINDDDIRIELIVDCETAVGYCISTIEKKVGEIDSIYIEEKYRENGFGTQLIENSKKWFNEKDVLKIIVTVAEGHESVFGFYQKHGFYPRLTYLEMKDIKQESNNF
jgi:diamine N-acetyltransferase